MLPSIPKFSHCNPTLISSLDDENEDENVPLPTHFPPVGSITHEPSSTPPLPRKIHTTCKSIGDIATNPIDQFQTHL